MSRVKVAVIGSGGIGSDVLIEVLRSSETLEMAAMVGIDPASEGLARADRFGVPTSARGVAGLLCMEHFDEIDIVFDATTAGAHKANAAALEPHGKRLIDLTSAALGPLVVPAVDLDQHLDAPNVNMVTCGGQATIPIVAAISRVTAVPYAEVVAPIASKPVGPGTRTMIDDFTETTSRAIEAVGGATAGRAIIVLDPAEPRLMRDTVLALIGDPDPKTHAAVRVSIESMIADVAAYIPGYRLKQPVQITAILPDASPHPPAGGAAVTHQVSVSLEVECATRAANVDLMTSAALRVAERIAATTSASVK
nr:acetaldehyde dehydrogenase (acetylating) [Nocardia aobensis]